VAIDEVDAVHAAIARELVTSRNRLRGQKVRFLRSLLDISQSGLARILGASRPSVARWEARPNTPIPPASDRLLRLIYERQTQNHGKAGAGSQPIDLTGCGKTRAVRPFPVRPKRK
jgi:DNA-binding transcriptional regulator YiaG